MPAWWYTHVSNQTLPSTDSASGGSFMSWAMPRKRPQWYGIAPPPWGMMSRSSGNRTNTSDIISWVNAVVSAPR